MRSKINRNNEIAEENINLTGHPASEKFERWNTGISEKENNEPNLRSYDEGIQDYNSGCGCGYNYGRTSEASKLEKIREKRIEDMDEVIQEDLDRL